MRFVFSPLLILLGILLFAYAGVDDSPGGQLLGIIVAVVGLVYWVRRKEPS